MKTSVFVIVFCFSMVSFLGQHCGFDQLDTHRHKNNHKHFEELLQRRGNNLSERIENVFLIPVVVHVIHHNEFDFVGVGDNISDEQIFSAIEVLNEDFRRKNGDTAATASWAKPVAADMKIEFKLASLDPNGLPTNGITRTKGSKESYNFFLDDEELKSLINWPTHDYLNIWVVSLSNNIVGYAQFPDSTNLQGLDPINGDAFTDGIVVAPYAFGRLTGRASGINNSFRFGRTTVHEVGHWLGLRHIFNNLENGCNYTDYCDDTPAQDKSNLGYSMCDQLVVGGCGEVVMHQNFMDYTNDVCMNLFTEDQKQRVRQVLEVSPRRAALRFSKGLCGSSKELDVPYIETFNFDSLFFANWSFSASNPELFDWELETGNLGSIVSDSLTKDSIVLLSSVVKYKSSENLFLRVESQSLQGADSLSVFYERSCSGNKQLLQKINYNSSEVVDTKISLKGLTTDGLLNFYFVLYNNGQETIINRISFYEESQGLLVQVFPNPINDKLNFDIKLPNDQMIDLYVFDVNGKMIFYNGGSLIHSGVYEVDLSFLKNGVYVARFVGDTASESIRFYKE